MEMQLTIWRPHWRYRGDITACTTLDRKYIQLFSFLYTALWKQCTGTKGTSFIHDLLCTFSFTKRSKNMFHKTYYNL